MGAVARTPRKTTRGEPDDEPVLLSGGNPRIPKGDGEAPVRAYLDAMPGWKREVGERLDALVARLVPGVRKAVRWNTPFYGAPESSGGRGWFLAFHCFERYVKVSFLRGAALEPPPPIASKQPGARYLHLHEDEDLDEAQLASWIEQAAALPGDELF